MFKKIDKFLLTLLLILIVIGFFIFSSASLGLLSREGARFSLIAGKQLAVLIASLATCFVFSHIPYQFWRRHAFKIFFISIVLTLLVFIPKIGFSAGGAHRWLNLGSFSFQPSELMKFGVILSLSAWFTSIGKKIETWRFGVLPFCVIMTAVGIILLLQPDMGTFIVTFLTGFSVFFAAGPKWKHLGTILLVSFCLLAVVAYMRPYARERLLTFFNPNHDTRGSSYQITQSWIALGSGGMFGRGFGQSIQKFNYLPEPIGDSIFAVAGEEFGFVGTTIIVIIFLLFGLWGLKIANRLNDNFGRLVTVGIVIMIVGQAFANMAAILGLIPLTGIPLIFISHGGSSLLITLAGMGIVFNISKHKQHRRIS